MYKLLVKLLKYPKTVLVVVLLLTVVFFISMKTGSRMETDLDEYMPQEHPAFVYSNQAEEWFDIKDSIIVAIENKEGIYNSGTIKKIIDITKAIQKIEGIEKGDVSSLYTADNIIGTEWGMEVKPFFKKAPKTAEELEILKNNVRNNEMINGRLISEDETVTLIVAELKVFSQELYHDIHDLSSDFEGPEKIYIAGRPIVEGTLAYLGPRDMKKMIPIVILVIVIILLIVIRSFRAALFTLLVVLFSTIWTFGLMAFLKVPIYAVSTNIPVMLIAIGVADGIHLYNYLEHHLLEEAGISRIKAVSNMISRMMNPVIMTSVTTAVGFIALLTSQVYPVKYFGLFTAFGVLSAMILSLFLIPAGIMVFGFPGWNSKKKILRKKEGKGKSLSAVFSGKIISYKYFIAAFTALIIAVSIYGTTRVWVDSSFLSKFEKDSEIVMTDSFINSKFGGTSTLNVIFDSPNEDAFKNPEVLRAVEDVQNDVENSLEVVGNSFSIVDYLKRMNKVLNEDRESFNTIPSTRNLVAQYLLLYEMSGDPENLWEVIDVKYNKANLTFQLKSDSSQAINSAIAVIEKHVPRLNDLGITINYAGSGYKGLVFTDLIIQGQILSIILSLIIVIVLLSFMFKNIAAGLIGSVPIIITAFIGFGIMGLFNIPLNSTTALLSSIAIGIGIDFAVHFIEQYRLNLLDNKGKIAAAELTMKGAGRALFFNAFVVIAGFLVLVFSVFPPNRALGTLVSLNMATSLIGTITIMFVMIYSFNIFTKHNKGE